MDDTVTLNPVGDHELAITSANVIADWHIIDSLIGQIYECAITPANWGPTIANIVETLCPVEWRSALLLSEFKSEKKSNCISSVAMTERTIDGYSQMFAVDNPYSKLAWPVRPGTMFDSSENVPQDIVENSPFQKDFLNPLGFSRVIALKLDHRSEEITFIAFLGPDGCMMDRLKRGLGILSPHLQRAIRVGCRITALQDAADAKQLATDRSPFATLTLDRNFSVLASSGRLQDYVDRAIVSIQYGRLAFCHPPSQRHLASMFDLSSRASQAFMVIDGVGHECPVLAARIPEHRAAGLGSIFTGASLIVSIGRSAGETPTLEINHLVQWFGLTPKQGQLAVALATGQNLQQYAALHGIKINTVRFQLKAIFSKTGTSSQGELLALLARLPSF